MIKSSGATLSRFFYLDVLRAVSIFAVIILHNACDPVNLYGKISNLSWGFACFYNGLTRFCVPMFLLLSGSLLLNKTRETSIKELFSKRLPKLLIPLVVWSVIYVVYQNICDHSFAAFNLKNTLLEFYKGPLVFHFWFLYMMVGIYLVYPILNLFITAANRQHVEYFLALWFILNCIIGVLNLTTQAYCSIDFTAFAGYTGYFVLGYYLTNFELSGKIVRVLYALSICAFIISISGIFVLKIYNVPHANDLIECDFTPEMPFAVAGLFLFFKNHNFTMHVRLHRLFHHISLESYGIYIVHVLVMRLLFDNLHFGLMIDKLNLGYSIPLKAGITLILAYIFTRILKRIPLIKHTV